MAWVSLSDLVFKALPAGFDRDKIRRHIEPGLKPSDKRLALEKALRSCQEIDWQAYMAVNGDARKAGVDPVRHFIQDGVFEGAKLYIKSGSGVNGEAAKTLKISVILIRGDNDLYLEKAVQSVLQQSLRAIEILAPVGGEPGDEGDNLLRALAAKDSRIHLYAAPEPDSPLAERKRAVALASGEYILFLHSTDYLLPGACETIYSAAGSRDLVAFGARVMYQPGLSQSQRNEACAQINRGSPRVFTAAEIIPAIYNDGKLSEHIWNKAYAASLCKPVYAAMGGGGGSPEWDAYEALALFSKAQNAIKIEDGHYVHRFSPGSGYDEPPAAGPGIRAVRNLFLAHNQAHYKGIRNRLIARAIDGWLEHSTPGNCRNRFDAIADEVGIADLLDILSRTHLQDWEMVANKFRHYGASPRQKKSPKSIGFLYGMMGDGGAERVCWELAPRLVEKGYEVTIFLETTHPNDSRFEPPIKIAYQGCPRDDWQAGRIRGLFTALQHNPVDVMLCHGIYDGPSLWQIMLLKYLGIAAIGFTHSAFTRRLLAPGSRFNIQAQAAMMRCLDSASVLSHYEELYYRNQGVDAQYNPNPVRLPEPGWTPPAFANREPLLVAIGRLSEPVKNVRDMLRILREAAIKIPEIRMVFIGSFNNENSRREFYQLAQRLGIVSRIEVTGWIDDFSPILDRAKILLSTAWTEAFPLSICEAQGRGLPVIMYELPIEPAENNPAIIRVGQGDINGAASEIASLLKDGERWRTLSETAREKMRQFGTDNYADRIDRMIQNCGRMSCITCYKPEDYRVVLRTLGFYATNPPPWQKK